jgi:hypothetical protein
MNRSFSIIFFILGAFLLTACATTSTTALPKPTNVKIIPPASNLDPNLAAFSGTWEGYWDGQLHSRLIVEQMNKTSARVIYIWDSSAIHNFPAGWRRIEASVLSGGKIHWGNNISFTFTMNKDHSSIEGVRRHNGALNLITMKKISTKNDH